MSTSEDHRICCGSFNRGSVTCPRGALLKLEAERQAKRDAAYAYLGDHLGDYTWGDKIPTNGA